MNTKDQIEAAASMMQGVGNAIGVFDPIPDNMEPTFYFTGTYEGDVEHQKEYQENIKNLWRIASKMEPTET